ncbi:BA14K-like protein [Mesorhizobium loti]|uniref:Lectin-like protein BA14k n=1 Tax=Rhizobium loti TaxID=381 RepID=A0A8E3B3F6_RHILI|nr:BA14K family protein [Mesorhizobium loti]PWJ89142.1 BA14K-like protein [Mesorhizobium loti]
MNKIVSGILATTLSVSFAAAAGPANAAQMFVPQAPATSSNILNVAAGDTPAQHPSQYPEWKRHGDRRNFSRNFNGNRNFARNNDRGVYWNGHRGYREYHRGYRRHGDNWFPLAAFATGALITGAIINSENNRVYEGNSHVQWCYDHYRSYRSSDNTFQPNYGPRQECRSPY